RDDLGARDEGAAVDAIDLRFGAGREQRGQEAESSETQRASSGHGVTLITCACAGDCARRSEPALEHRIAQRCPDPAFAPVASAAAAARESREIAGETLHARSGDRGVEGI